MQGWLSRPTCCTKLQTYKLETLDSSFSPATVKGEAICEIARPIHLTGGDSLVPLPSAGRSGGGRVGEPRISSCVQVGLGRLIPGGVGEAARPGWCLQVEVVLFGGAARWSSATDLPPSSCSRFLGAVLRDFPSPVAVVRRRRMYRVPKVEAMLKHGDGVGVPGWRPLGFEVRRLPDRRRAPSDPRRGRSCGGAPAARPVARQRHRVLAGLICNFEFVLDFLVRTVF